MSEAKTPLDRDLLGRLIIPEVLLGENWLRSSSSYCGLQVRALSNVNDEEVPEEAFWVREVVELDDSLGGLQARLAKN